MSDPVPSSGAVERPATAAPLLEARGVSVAFRDERGADRPVLRDVSFAVRDDEIICVLGPSGGGKSTLLRVMLGLMPPAQGEVRYRGKPLGGVCPNASVVFQASALFPWLTVAENIRVGLNGRGLRADEEAARLRRVLDLVGLEGYETMRPRELSRGMKQRVGLARALVGRPEVLLLDEPFAGLDVLTAEAMRSELYRLWRDRTTGLKSIVLVTNQIEEAVFFGDRIVILGADPGHVREIFHNRLRHPREQRSREFLDVMERVHAVIAGIHLPDLPAADAKAVAGRPIPLPRVPVSEIVGLLEVLHDHGGQMDLFEVNELIADDFGHTISVVKAAELLGLVRTPGDAVHLSGEGYAFVAEDVNARKRRFRRRLLAISTFRRVTSLLENAPEKEAPAELFEDDFALTLPTEPPGPLLETVVRWGQFGELIAYDADRRTLALPPPEGGP
ncbi:MAG TPA: ATP-binding cassette domain-containing protein [Planctomycetota bacterium]|nr:ATP-binding cassette domain-containing protein [Planctomycetota bacterium]